MDLRNKKILFLGDSITQGSGASGEDKIYHAVAARILGATALNYGVSGTRIAKQTVCYQAADFPEYFLQRAKRMDRQADLVVVFGGTNDFGHGSAPFGEIGDTDGSTFCGAFRELLAYLTSVYGKDKVVVLYPLRRWNEDNPRGDGCKPADVQRLVGYYAAEKAITEEFGVKSIDLWNEKTLNPNLPEGKNNFVDGLHPNDDGHRILGEKIAQALLQM